MFFLNKEQKINSMLLIFLSAKIFSYSTIGVSKIFFAFSAFSELGSNIDTSLESLEFLIDLALFVPNDPRPITAKFIISI